MFKLKYLFLAGLLLLSSSIPAQVQPVSTEIKPEITLAVLAFRDKESTYNRWLPLADYLSEHVDSVRFNLLALHNVEMEQAVAEGRVDFVLIQPAQYVLLTYRNSLTSPLASLLNYEGDFVTDHFGGVIFTLAKRDDLMTLKDLKGKRIAAASLTGLGAYQMQAFELLQQGVVLPDEVDLIETGQPQRNAVEAVLTGRADAGFVRTGVLEELIKRGDLTIQDLKLMNAQRIPSFPFLTSTRLYPEWPFAAMPHVDKDIIRQVAAALLALPHQGELAHSMGIAGFSIPGDYRTIDDLMRQLRLEPFDQFEFTLEEMFKRWFYELIAFALILISLLIVFIFLLYKHQRRLRRDRRHLSQVLEQIRLFQNTVDQSPESIIITDHNARIQYLNPQFEKVTGYKTHEVLGQNPRFLQSGLTSKETYQQMWQALITGQVWRGEVINQRKNNEHFPCEVIMSSVKNSEGEITHFFSIQRDITDQKQREQRIEQLLYVDNVTGIANRNQLLDVMDEVLHRSMHSDTKGCLVLVNLSRFKFINQLYGQAVGDEVLTRVAQRLQRAFENIGLTARLAADEFAVFCENKAEFDLTEEWMTIMGQRALTSVDERLEVQGEQFNLRISVGVAPFISAEESSSDTIFNTLNEANIALKQARAKGEHQLVIFDHHLLEESIEQHRLAMDLQKAVALNQLRLFVQPQFDLNKQLVGLECLVRWQHPQKGLLPPAVFIGIAEQSDLIVSIGDWVLEQACLLLAEVQQRNPSLRVAVNISPKQFRKAQFVERCQACLEQANAQAQGLMLEITENLFLDDFAEMIAKMKQLKALGIRFSIDDFGTGYSSLSYLQHLPVDEVKIDRSFIMAMDEYGFERSLVSSIYALGKQMQLKVVAEGVETEQQLANLLELNDLELQGFLFAKPTDSQEWLKGWMQ
jgi:diguanylate cyclase (GGDEF)-like protein/PAS domain S-box-containing protein